MLNNRKFVFCKSTYIINTVIKSLHSVKDNKYLSFSSRFKGIDNAQEFQVMLVNKNILFSYAIMWIYAKTQH